MPRKSEIEARKKREQLIASVDSKLDAKTQKKMAAEYIRGGITLLELGKKYGLTKDEVYAVAREGKWTPEKRRYAVEHIRKATDKAIDIESDRLAELMAASDKFDKHLMKLLNSEETDIFTPQDMSYMARALKDAVTAKRIIYDLPTLEEQARIKSHTGKLNIESEKLQLLKKQADQGGERKEIDVVMTDEFKELSE